MGTCLRCGLGTCVYAEYVRARKIEICSTFGTLMIQFFSNSMAKDTDAYELTLH